MNKPLIPTSINYFVVFDPIANAPICLAMIAVQNCARKPRATLEGSAIASVIMFFFALCGALTVGDLNTCEAALKVTSGIILFLVALDMLAAKQQHKLAKSYDGDIQDEIRRALCSKAF